MLKSLLLLISILVSCSAFAHEPEFSDRTDMNHILQSYSDRTGVKFVTDPRVKARVNMIGIKLEDLDQTDLNKILLIHNFVAYEKSGVVYVIPKVLENEIGQEIGEKWQKN